MPAKTLVVLLALVALDTMALAAPNDKTTPCTTEVSNPFCNPKWIVVNRRRSFRFVGKKWQAVSLTFLHGNKGKFGNAVVVRSEQPFFCRDQYPGAKDGTEPGGWRGVRTCELDIRRSELNGYQWTYMLRPSTNDQQFFISGRWYEED